MKHLKTKLMASVAMLMVATVMLSSASFAWFTISTAPEVKGVNTQLATNGNLEMALANVATTDGTVSWTLPSDSTSNDTGSNVAWGNVIDLSSYFATSSDYRKLRPVQVATNSDAATGASASTPVIQSPKFGDDGRMNKFKDLTAVAVDVKSDDATKGKVIEYQGKFTDSDTSAVAWAYRADYFIRTNTAGDISLADEAADRGNGVTGGGCFIQDKNGTSTSDYLNGITVYSVITKMKSDGTKDGSALFTGNLLENKTFKTDKLFTAEANAIYLVETYVCWNGANLTNADMATADQNVALNIQFEHSGNLKSLAQ